MTGRPTGTVTFLFTDIEGSTARWEHQTEAMQAALARHDALLRAAILEHGGYVVKTMGDAFHAAFSRAPDALAAAVGAQRRLSAEPWDEIGGLRVRMALHTGAAEERDGDYYGPPLNRAARLMSAGHGGQILLSQTTYDLVRDTPPAGTDLLDLGEHRLKDLIHPERIFQIVAPDLPSEFPSLQTLERRPHNLPVHPTALLGRDDDVSRVRARLLRDDVHLLTLTGPGGTGKTRLGLQVAAELIDRFTDGVSFVALAPIADPDLVAATIAQTLDVRVDARRPVIESLKEYLAGKQMLLLLDNFEQVLPAASVVSDLLSVAPRLKILVTSRAALQVRGEHEEPVPPLALPDLREACTPASLSQYGAVSLFVERSSAIKPDFTVTNENAPAIAEICHRLDGLPLAIELAAARTRLLTPQAILARLERRLPLLTGGARDLPARQQTLRNAIAWSYDLLSPAEQALYRRLSVFVGGWTLDAAEALCDPEGTLGLDMLDGMASLAAQSLIRHAESPHGEPRFTMLETIREFGQEKLEEVGEHSAIRQRHRDWYLAFAERVSAELRGPRQAELFDRLAVEHDNLRSALEWSTVEGNGVGAGATFAECLAWFWVLRGHLGEGRARLERLIARAPARGPIRATILSVAGFLAERQGDYASAQPLLEEALRLWRLVENHRGVATVLWSLRVVVAARGDADRSSALLHECVALFRKGGAEAHFDAVIAGYAESPIGSLAALAQQQGDYSTSQTLYDEDLALARARVDSHGVANALRGLGSLACYRHDLERAADLLGQSLHRFRDLRDIPCIGLNLSWLAVVAGTRNQRERAAQMFAAAEVLQQRSGVGLPASVRALHDRRKAQVRSVLGEIAFEAASSEGRSMTLDEVVAYALEETPPS